MAINGYYVQVTDFNGHRLTYLFETEIEAQNCANLINRVLETHCASRAYTIPAYVEDAFCAAENAIVDFLGVSTVEAQDLMEKAL